MTEDLKNLENDADGMATYDYIVNHVGTCREVMLKLLLKICCGPTFQGSSSLLLQGFYGCGRPRSVRAVARSSD